MPISRPIPAGGYYGQAIRPFNQANESRIAQLSEGAPQTLVNPNYYNTERGRAELAQSQQSGNNQHLQELRDALDRQSQVVQEGSQVYSPEERAMRQSAISAGQSALALTSPFVHAGLLDTEGATHAANQALTDEFNQQRNINKAQADWGAIEKASRGGYSQQQVASAVADFHRVHGVTANYVPGFQAYMGNQAPIMSPSEYMPLQSKVMGSIAGLSAQEASAARQGYVTAVRSLSQPGVNKQDAEQMQQQFVQAHPAFASQVGLPQAMTKDQFISLSQTVSFASAQDEAGGVPLVTGHNGQVVPNPGWLANQNLKARDLQATREDRIKSHQALTARVQADADYLKMINPGKKPVDATEIEEWKAAKTHFDSVAKELRTNREAMLKLVNAGSTPDTQQTVPVSNSSVLNDSNPQAFANPTQAQQAFKAGKVVANKAVIVAGRKVAFDKDGRPYAVKD